METIKSPVDILKSEEGFALLAVLLALLILSVIGIVGTKTTDFELKIAANERQANQIFYTADSGWKQSGPFLNALASAPDFVNLTLNPTDPDYLIVRNFGEGGDGILNANFPDNTEDGGIRGIPYWYRIVYQADIPAVGFGTGYRDFQYLARCNANKTTAVNAQVSRVYQVGY